MEKLPFTHLFEKLGETPPDDYLLPKVSIILPSLNQARLLGLTLETILKQTYPQLEILVIDGGSTDRTKEIVSSFFDDRIQFISVENRNLYGMMNQGILQATGLYVNFLQPGEFLLSEHSVKDAVELTLVEAKPDFVFGAAIRRTGREQEIIRHPFRSELLQLGIQPTHLSAMWFHHHLFKKVDIFTTDYRERGDFDLLCRMMKNRLITYRHSTKIITDEEQHVVPLSKVYANFRETGRIIYLQFGSKAFLKWLIYQKEVSQLFRLWLMRVKSAFIGNA